MRQPDFHPVSRCTKERSENITSLVNQATSFTLFFGGTTSYTEALNLPQSAIELALRSKAYTTDLGKKQDSEANLQLAIINRLETLIKIIAKRR